MSVSCNSIQVVRNSQLRVGTQPFLVTTKDNIEELQKPGSLAARARRNRLPRTIRDAMTLVGILGMRFLWIDALCIIQDDPVQKHRDIANMAGIYANASLTIIAAQGLEADSGLKGISTPRSFPFQSVNIGGKYEHIIIPVDFGSDSPFAWKNRGWTFQESLLSSRGLVFKNDIVSWQCGHGARKESVLRLEAEKTSLTNEIQGWMLSPKSNKLEIGNFMIFLSEFNSRFLSYPEDAVFAFNGIASVMRQSFKGGFISGLPAAFFHAALLWDINSEYVFHPYTRRRAKRSTTNSCLPSWSWIGWQCKLYFLSWPHDPEYTNTGPGAPKRRIMPLVDWYHHLSPSSKGQLIKSSWYEFEAKYFDNDRLPCPPGWTRHPNRSPRIAHMRPRCLYTYEDINKSWKYPIPFPSEEEQRATIAMVMAPFISCTTRRGWLVVDQKSEDQYDVSLRYLRDDFGRQIGRIRPHSITGDPNISFLDQRLELIEIARGYSYDDPAMPGPEKPFPYFRINGKDTPEMDGSEATATYHVMYIQWENGIAYRRGIGEVRQDLWEAQYLESIHIMLG